MKEFEEYFEENFIIDKGYCFSKTLSTNKEYRQTFIDKDDLKELWEAALASIGE